MVLLFMDLPYDIRHRVYYFCFEKPRNRRLFPLSPMNDILSSGEGNELCKPLHLPWQLYLLNRGIHAELDPLPKTIAHLTFVLFAKESQDYSSIEALAPHVKRLRIVGSYADGRTKALHMYLENLSLCLPHFPQLEELEFQPLAWVDLSWYHWRLLLHNGGNVEESRSWAVKVLDDEVDGIWEIVGGRTGLSPAMEEHRRSSQRNLEEKIKKLYQGETVDS